MLYNLWVITNIVNTKIHFGRATRLVFSVSSSAESARMACRYISIRNLVLYYLWCHNRKVAWFVKYNCDVLIFRHNVEWWAEQMQAYLRSILWAKVEQLEDSYLLTFIIGTSILQQMQTSICIFVCILKKFLTFIKSYGWLFLFKKNLRGFQKPSAFELETKAWNGRNILLVYKVKRNKKQDFVFKIWKNTLKIQQVCSWNRSNIFSILQSWMLSIDKRIGQKEVIQICLLVSVILYYHELSFQTYEMYYSYLWARASKIEINVTYRYNHVYFYFLHDNQSCTLGS